MTPIHLVDGYDRDLLDRTREWLVFAKNYDAITDERRGVAASLLEGIEAYLEAPATGAHAPVGRAPADFFLFLKHLSNEDGIPKERLVGAARELSRRAKVAASLDIFAGLDQAARYHEDAYKALEGRPLWQRFSSHDIHATEIRKMVPDDAARFQAEEGYGALLLEIGRLRKAMKLAADQDQGAGGNLSRAEAFDFSQQILREALQSNVGTHTTPPPPSEDDSEDPVPVRTGLCWRAHDLIPGHAYQSVNFGLATYEGVDFSPEESRLRFITHAGHIFCHSSNLNKFLTPKEAGE